VPASALAADVAKVVETEAPVHFDEVARRILDASGVSRLGSRIRAAIERAASLAERKSRTVRRGDFLYRVEESEALEAPPRDRSTLPSRSRSLDLVAPEELRGACLQVIRRSYGIAPDDLPLPACRLLGFDQTSQAMRAAVDSTVNNLVARGAVEKRGGMLVARSAAQ
jgi:hypothetical protein